MYVRISTGFATISRIPPQSRFAISGIIVVGALLQIGQGNTAVSILAFIAILIASVNIFGGFFVTHRMLNMFRKG